jgi:hypothetical protein
MRVAVETRLPPCLTHAIFSLDRHFTLAGSYFQLKRPCSSEESLISLFRGVDARFEHLTRDPAWLRIFLPVSDPPPTTVRACYSILFVVIVNTNHVHGITGSPTMSSFPRFRRCPPLLFSSPILAVLTEERPHRRSPTAPRSKYIRRESFAGCTLFVTALFECSHPAKHLTKAMSAWWRLSQQSRETPSKMTHRCYRPPRPIWY